MPLLIQRTMLHSRYIRGQLRPGNLPNGRCLLLVVCRKSEKCSPHPKALRAWGRKSTHTGRRKSFPSVSCALIPSHKGDFLGAVDAGLITPAGEKLGPFPPRLSLSSSRFLAAFHSPRAIGLQGMGTALVSGRWAPPPRLRACRRPPAPQLPLPRLLPGLSAWVSPLHLQCAAPSRGNPPSSGAASPRPRRASDPTAAPRRAL